MKARLVGLLVALALVVSGCATTGGSVEVTGLNDSFEDQIKVSTFNYSRPFMGVVNPSDHFFRGYIDKKTKAATYQLYTIINSVDWVYWDEARVLVNGDLKKIGATRVGSDVKCSQYGCAHYEDVLVVLDRNMLNEWASSSIPIKVRYISIRVSNHLDIDVNPNEVKLFLKNMSATK